MNKLILIRMCQFGFILFLITACVSVNPGEFKTSYRQLVLQTQDPIKKVTILQLAIESQKEMIAQQGTVVVGKSQFKIDSDDIDWDVLNAQAKAQAKKIKANVVLMSQAYLKDTTKIKTIEIKSEFQKIADEIPLVVGGEASSESSTKESKTTGTKNNYQTETKGHTGSVGVSGGATLGQLSALVPGNIKHKDVTYDAKVYEIHAIFIRTNNYPGLKK